MRIESLDFEALEHCLANAQKRFLKAVPHRASTEVHASHEGTFLVTGQFLRSDVEATLGEWGGRKAFGTNRV